MISMYGGPACADFKQGLLSYSKIDALFGINEALTLNLLNLDCISPLLGKLDVREYGDYELDVHHSDCPLYEDQLEG